MKTKFLFSIFAVALMGNILSAAAQGTAFTYQGRLDSNSAPVSGNYDLKFTLFATNVSGEALTGPVTNNAVTVSNGLFMATIDFGGSSFTGGSNWMEIAVRPHGNGSFDTLSPRQQITSTPYAITAENLAGVVMNNIISGAGETVGGGNNNAVSNFSSTIGGGANNVASGNAAIVGGGSENQATSDHATIDGGQNNLIQSGADHSTISGGNGNVIQSGAFESFVGGGQGNIIETNAVWSTISGGLNNVIQPSQNYATISGGDANTINYNGTYASIGGGLQNTASGEYSTVPGGAYNSAEGAYSFACGSGASAVHQGAFVWADSQNALFSSSANDSFNVRAIGGVVFTSGETSGGQPNHSVKWAPGGASWSFSSDRNLKDRISTVDAGGILDKVSQLPVVEWSYKGYEQRHIGPMAQDFHRLFPLNDNDKMLEEADLHGVELAAIQGLNQKLNDRDVQIQTLQRENDSLSQRLTALEAAMKRTGGQ